MLHLEEGVFQGVALGCNLKRNSLGYNSDLNLKQPSAQAALQAHQYPCLLSKRH